MFNEFRTKYLTNFWDVGRSMIILAIVATIYFGIFGGGWAVTGEMTRWGGEFLELFGIDLSGYSYYEITNLNGNALTRFEGLMLIGMFVGATIAAFMANKVKFRLPASRVRVFQAIVGGILSGFGARLAFGCNLLDFFTGLPYFSLHTWLFAVFMVLGIYTAVKVGKMKLFLPKVELEKHGAHGKGISHDKTRADRNFAIGAVLFMLALVWFGYLLATSPEFDIKNKASILPLGLLFGLIFGFIVSKGQICFTSCFRDLFLFGRDVATKGAFYGMIIATLIVFVLMLNGYAGKVTNFSPAVAIGAFLFGFGIVFAGGCECGWTYRATEGQLHFMIVGIANVVGTAVLALSYDAIPAWVKDGPKIQLLETFGTLGGLAVNLSLFVGALLLVFFYKRRFFARGGY